MYKRQSLDCNSNQLTSLNVQGLINLRYLDCSRNQLTSLNIKGTNLKGNEHFFENAEINIIDLNDFEMPLFSVDKENMSGHPKDCLLYTSRCV